MSIPIPYWKEPQNCAPGELAAFAATVREGGEVIGEGLDERIKQAVRLIFCQHEGRLVGVAALKTPLDSYRFKLSRKSGVQLPRDACPHELGWVFVTPSERGKGLSANLVACAIEGLNSPVFATSRTDNAPMHATLRRVGFVAVGDEYKSDQGEHRLQIFTREGKG